MSTTDKLVRHTYSRSLPGPWIWLIAGVDTPPEDLHTGRVLTEQLRQACGVGHPLHGMKLKAIARCEQCSDVIVQIGDDEEIYAALAAKYGPQYQEFLELSCKSWGVDIVIAGSAPTLAVVRLTTQGSEEPHDRQPDVKVFSWTEAADVARTHWEDRHPATAGQFTFFGLHPVGPCKTAFTGTWADVLEHIPYFLQFGDNLFIPPLADVSETLAEGAKDFGMSGGCEWQRHQLSPDEYEATRQQIIACNQQIIARKQSLAAMVKPEWVKTEADERAWRASLHNGYSIDANRALDSYYTELFEAMARAKRDGNEAEIERARQEQRRYLRDGPEAWLAEWERKNGRT